ncbi:MAG: hypothetical protein HRT95_05625 [Moritella sp.]|uniref:hypothetical protein n=1 Tax=Moritella sp. TaxID=78556 RepID=UPI001DA67477|nr:hypothetical protein [Moritella sp.]NQZ49670.1 hypothetical protein [Moritella sp.]
MKITPDENTGSLSGRISFVNIKDGNDGPWGSIGVITDDSYMNKDKVKVERSQAITVEMKAHTLLALAEILNKGDSIHLKYVLRVDKWKDKTSGLDRKALKSHCTQIVSHTSKAAKDCLKQAGIMKSPQQAQQPPQQAQQPPQQQSNNAGWGQPQQPQQPQSSYAHEKAN